LKIISFLLDGQPTYGLVQDGTYLQPPADFRARHPDVVSVLRAGALAELEQRALASGTRVDPGLARTLPAIPQPRKFLCVGLNYKSHIAEMNRDDPEHPAIFLRLGDTIVAHGDTVEKPAFSDTLDWEGELAIVIGRGGRSIPRDQALAHVAGYACFNDISVREFQRHTHQWTPGKNFPGTGPLGPWLVTADEVGDVNGLTLETRLNGNVVQHASVSDLIYSIPVIIEYISRFTPLAPGDVIATGTPSGVGSGRKPPLYMKGGDTIEVEITGLGVLRNRIVDQAA
jgi:2-keto-4-pentenoate hydratase/2-oxohepta-3-ene-1,7-dioic acid hydratase in catechol pathway